MRTPLDAFHVALQNLMEQKRAHIRELAPVSKPRRAPAQIYEGERVIYRPPRNLPEGEKALADGTYGAHGRIRTIGPSKLACIVTFDAFDFEQVVDLRWLDAEPLTEGDVDAALASIMRSIRGE